MKFGNILTNAQADELSTEMPVNVQHATEDQIWEQRPSEGWRVIIETASAPDGHRVESYKVQEIDKQTARLVPDKIVNLADEVGAQAVLHADEAAYQAAALEAQAALQLTQDERAKECQIRLEWITSASIKGLLAALLQEINKRPPFDHDPVSVAAIYANMSETVTAELEGTK